MENIVNLENMSVVSLKQEELENVGGGWVPILAAGIGLGLYIGHHLFSEE